MRFETAAIQSQKTENLGSDVSQSIHLSTTFEREPDGSYSSGFVYSRMGNPNRTSLEKTLAILEQGKRALAFSSGMAAISAVFDYLKPGDQLLLPHDVFFATLSLAKVSFVSRGIKVETVDMSKLAAVQIAIRPETALVWIESPSNPLLNITDIEAIVQLAKPHGALVGVDNTWPTPVLQQPLVLGADVVMHSTTKYFGGHSDVLGGCLVFGRKDKFFESVSERQILNGAVPSPLDCWLVARGLKSLHLRVIHQSQSAAALARFLSSADGIEQVHYPGLESHSGNAVAAKQMKGGFGGMLSVQVSGGEKRAMEIAARLNLFTSATSLGGVESLVEHRKSVEGCASDTPDNLLRISVGLEHVDDLIDDWTQALVS